MMIKIRLAILTLCLTISVVYQANSQKKPQYATENYKGKAKIYKKGWIDLNKNKKKDPYEDPTLSIDRRIEDLLSRMNIEEKTCQMVTLYGYKRVLEDDLPNESWKNKLWKDGIGAIDEHLNGFQGWGKPPMNNEYCWPASKHAWAMNEVQRFFIEETRLGIPADFTNEGIRGVENYIATNFPTQLGIGHTWNKDLVRRIGEITGEEARILGYTNVYAPILDVGRDQRWGRYEEVYGESPYLVSELGIQMVKGLQKDYQLASTAKHYAVYSVNKGAREGLSRCDPKTSPREIENIFLMPFKRVIKEANILGVMSSYNDYDGIPVQGSSYWLNDRLRGDFGFRGYVVSDSDAVIYLYNKHKTAKDYKEAVFQSVMAGLNMRCTFRSPDSYVEPLRELVKEGRIPMSVIDERVRDILRVKFTVGIFDKPYVVNTKKADEIVHSEENQKVALQASRESIVLLKNKNKTLPLDINKIKTIAISGPNANDSAYAVTHYGPLAVDVTTVLDGIKEKAGDKVKVLYTKGCDIVDANWPDSEILPSPISDKEQKEIDKAVEQAKKADVAVVVAGGSQRTCGENKSRSSLNLPGRQLDLIKAIEATGKPLIVVLINGRPLSINWVNKNIPAIIEAWYPGSQGGTAIADVIFGDYNPGGKLTVSFPKTVGQIPLNFPAKPNSNLNAWGKRARVNDFLYPFGYGLSYTTFEYSKLEISPRVQTPDKDITVSFYVKNTGKTEGDEIVQLYIRDMVSIVTTYEKNLRGFERVHLKAGETKKVTFTIKPRDIQLLDLNMNWIVEEGDFLVMIGASSTNIKLKKKFTVAKKENLEEVRENIKKQQNILKFVKADNNAGTIIKVLDKNQKTYWKSNKKGVSIEMELSDNAQPSEIALSWYKGNERKYKFEIQLSGGGGQWQTVYKGESSGKTVGFETIKFKGFPATDLKIKCFGNDKNKISAINEIKISEFKGN